MDSLTQARLNAALKGRYGGTKVSVAPRPKYSTIKVDFYREGSFTGSRFLDIELFEKQYADWFLITGEDIDNERYTEIAITDKID